MRASEADPQSFEELYTSTVRQVYGAIFMAVQHVQTAEDLTSETYIKAQRGWPPRSGEAGGRRAWLLAIARNVVRDHLRAEQRRPARSLDDPGGYDALPAGDPALDEQAEVREALWSLSERDQELLRLRLAGFSNAEIGQALELTPDAVCVAIRRALQRMAQKLEQRL
jgi:RNA polymerase sigma factor (sigma-70 family)